MPEDTTMNEFALTGAPHNTVRLDEVREYLSHLAAAECRARTHGFHHTAEVLHKLLERECESFETSFR